MSFTPHLTREIAMSIALGFEFLFKLVRFSNSQQRLALLAAIPASTVITLYFFYNFVTESSESETSAKNWGEWLSNFDGNYQYQKNLRF